MPHFLSPAKVSEHQIVLFTIFGQSVREWKLGVCMEPTVDLVLPCVKNAFELPQRAVRSIEDSRPIYT